ncbi:hypothetical protein N7495_006760 [Penicillium taxi]|uniref:uncharacterized protein n=1 Tax=Penicillium taxi TaxID=168475 RepID=UPI0025456B25|nr:uncharacterized protein N7495_006760 [Penicillium taxi]KAJ5895069.1 hypothetical protein N7495_006760 [Penicillium taxi]
MWIGKLYGILCVAITCQDKSNPIIPNLTGVLEKYTHKINQCLIIGKYDECPPDTIETLSFALGTRFVQKQDPNIGNLILLGVVIRMARRMGYHRDASYFPKISPFDGEMRRRVWHLITDMDTMMSLSVGLPRLLKESQSDTARPRNLLDEDFDEDSTALPPSRPDHLHTPCQWLLANNKMNSVFGAIADFSTSVRLPSYADAMKLDKLLDDTYASLPENLHERSLEMSLLDDTRIIFHRILLALTRSRAKCVLHYRYLAPARTEEKFSYSRDACVHACLHIHEYHCLVNKEIQPGGRLFSDRWRTRGPMINGMFMSATTMLCLELNYDILVDLADSKHIPLAENLRMQIVEALQNSYQHWAASSEGSDGSKKTVQVLDLILIKIRGQKQTTPSGPAASIPTFPGPLTQSTSPAWHALDQGLSNPLDHEPYHSAPYSNMEPGFLDLVCTFDFMCFQTNR